MIGKTLGHYEIIEPLGAGGMGEVYRARDTNLDRDVAIKVLPEDFAEDAERLARFEREAKLLASLNHTNIATIHGLEDSDGVRFIAMELVEGETLADRLAASGGIDVEEALRIAGQIAEALEAAHDSGVIHRDLKPANVKVTPGGKVKVLDFGLAKAWSPEASEIDLTRSPTITVEGTATGVIMGTAAYMSPEQAKGKSLDKRTDIFSFGCVLYEMLTGRTAFAREDVSETMAAILRDEPDWNLLPPGTPPMVRSLLRRCLRKDPSRRLRDIGDARIEIEDALVGVSDPAGITAGVGADALSGADTTGIDALAYGGIAASKNRRVLVAVMVGALAVGLTSGAVLIGPLTQPVGPAEAAVRRMSIHLGPDLRLENLGVGNTGPLAISPDGSMIVFEGRSDAGRQLYLRRLDEWEARPIPDTEGGGRPFFSPDGQWIGYSSGGLWKVQLSGGVPIEVSETADGLGATWSPDGTIVQAMDLAGLLFGVSADGGDAQPLTQFNSETGEVGHESPSILPDGRSVLFTVWNGGTYFDSDIGVLSLDTGEHTVIQEGGSHPVYVPTGHLVYARRGQLVAVRFDLDTLSTVGTPVPVIDDMLYWGGYERPVFSISSSGELAYVRHDPWLDQARLVWLNREGDVTPVEGAPLPPQTTQFKISSDGRKLAFMTVAPADIWTYDLTDGNLIKVTQDPGFDNAPVWADGDERIAFGSARSGIYNVWWKRADGLGEAEALLPHDTDPDRVLPPISWSPDGVLALQGVLSLEEETRLWLLPLQGDRSLQPFKTDTIGNPYPQFSPDGKLLAYESSDQDHRDVYVEPIPQTREIIRVSGRNGGVLYTGQVGAPSPMWSADGTRLFFYEATNQRRLMVVPIYTEPELSAGTPELFFEAPANTKVLPFETSQGVLGVVTEPRPVITQIEVVLNFAMELKRLVPTEQ